MSINNIKKLEFIKSANQIHGIGRYGYDDINCNKKSSKVKINCNIHNIKFEQLQWNHLHGAGCPKCSIEFRANKNKISKDKFILDAIKIHGNTAYNYDFVDYIHSKKIVKIKCNLCGIIFNQTPNGHLTGRGCRQCGINRRVLSRTKLLEKFIIDSNNIHNNYYTYCNAIYKTRKDKIIITCPKHGDFTQGADCHLSGKGCRKCKNIISKGECEFLEYCSIPDDAKHRQFLIKFKDCSDLKYCKPDGYDDKTNTIYEYLGNYWHGNPKTNNMEDRNIIAKKTFQELNELTFKKMNILKSMGYAVKYIWEYDWKQFKRGIDKLPKIATI